MSDAAGFTAVEIFGGDHDAAAVKPAALDDLHSPASYHLQGGSQFGARIAAVREDVAQHEIARGDSLQHIRRAATGKLSDNQKKAMGPLDEIARYRRVFGVRKQESVEVIVKVENFNSLVLGRAF